MGDYKRNCRILQVDNVQFRGLYAQSVTMTVARDLFLAFTCSPIFVMLFKVRGRLPFNLNAEGAS